MFEKIKKVFAKQNTVPDLFEMLEQQDIAGARLLLENMEVNVRNSKGETPLMIGAQNGWKEFTEELIQAHADIDLQDKEGKTALMHCFLNNQLKTARLLVDAGAELGLMDKKGHTAAFYAIQKGLATLMSFPEKDRKNILMHSFKNFLDSGNNENDTAIQFIYEYLLKSIENLSEKEKKKFLNHTLPQTLQTQYGKSKTKTDSKTVTGRQKKGKVMPQKKRSAQKSSQSVGHKKSTLTQTILSPGKRALQNKKKD